MKTNMFGDLRPANFNEITEAIVLKDVMGSNVNAEVEADDDGKWTAEVRDNVTGDEQFTVVDYPSKAALTADLKAAGITDIQDI